MADPILNSAGIYVIRNTLNGKRYVGSAKSFKVRFRTHRKYLRAGRHHSNKLQRAWTKYGEAAFLFEIIEIVEDQTQLREREQHWIDTLDPVRLGYNMTPTAGSLLGFTLTKEAKDKISLAHKGKPKTPEHCQAMRGKRAPFSEAAKANMRATPRPRLGPALKRYWQNIPADIKLAKARKLTEAKRQKKLAIQGQLALILPTDTVRVKEAAD